MVLLTLQLTESQTDALRVVAERDGASVETVAVRAIKEYIERHSLTTLVNRSLDRALPRYAEVLRRLGE